MITGRTVCCGLIGDPVAHSLSPVMHNAAFFAQGLDYVYLAFRVDSRNVDLALAGLKVLGARGFNVTVPHKISILPFLDELDDLARKVGAVNTVVNDAGRLKGYNTDVVGFKRALDAAGFDPRCQKAVILGAGGVARAAAYALAEMDASIIIITRPGSLDKGKALASMIGHCAFALDTSGLEASLNGAALLVNATSAGMHPRLDETLVPQELLTPSLTLFDMVYVPRDTRLLREAKAAGCRVIEGLEMLLYQGAAAFELWTGAQPSIEIMRQAAVQELTAQ
jgi:shikimate dehydrogenase